MLKDNRGVSLAEYGAILAIIGAVIALAALSISDHIASKLDQLTREYTVETSTEIRKGQAAFIRPGDMEVGNWYPLEFVAGPSILALADEAEDAPLTPARPIYVSHDMYVRLLNDPNFQIRAKSKALQETGEDVSATWQWDVKPVRVGTHTLIAQVDVLKRKPDGRFERFNRYSRRVSVRVSVDTMQGVINAIRNGESLGDALGALFRSWSVALKALLGLIILGFGISWAVRRYRRRAPKPSELGLP